MMGSVDQLASHRPEMSPAWPLVAAARAGGASSPGRVSLYVTGGFDRYVRILHHASTLKGEQKLWRDIWPGNALDLDPGLMLPPSPDYETPPPRLSLDELDALADALRLSAHSPINVGVWVGWGTEPPSWSQLPTYQAARQCRLIEARFDDLAAASRRAEHPAQPLTDPLLHPYQWWDATWRWCVATEIDFDSTLVAGDDTLIERILNTPALETIEVTPETHIHPAA